MIKVGVLKTLLFSIRGYPLYMGRKMPDWNTLATPIFPVIFTTISAGLYVFTWWIAEGRQEPLDNEIWSAVIWPCGSMIVSNVLLVSLGIPILHFFHRFGWKDSRVIASRTCYFSSIVQLVLPLFWQNHSGGSIAGEVAQYVIDKIGWLEAVSNNGAIMVPVLLIVVSTWRLCVVYACVHRSTGKIVASLVMTLCCVDSWYLMYQAKQVLNSIIQIAMRV